MNDTRNSKTTAPGADPTRSSGPDLSVLEAMDEAGLREYLAFLLHQYRVADAFWFIRVEEAYGLNVAEKLNERVWGKVSQLAARDIKRRFGVTETGLEGFVKALRLFPWSFIVGFEMRMEDGGLTLEVPACPAQLGRLKYGRGEYACKAMHMAEFKSFAHEIDPAIRVECRFAPPDPHPETLFCSWRFTVGE